MRIVAIMLAAAAALLPAGAPAHAFGVAEIDYAAITANHISAYGLSPGSVGGQDLSLGSALTSVEQDITQQSRRYSSYLPGTSPYLYWPCSYSNPTYAPYVYVVPYYNLAW